MRLVSRAIAVGLLTLVSFSPVQAAPRWYVAEVSGAGIRVDGRVAIRLVDTAGTFGPQWFFAVQTVQKEMLATVLTALSADLVVYVYTDPDEPGVPEIFNLYARK